MLTISSVKAMFKVIMSHFLKAWYVEFSNIKQLKQGYCKLLINHPNKIQFPYIHTVIHNTDIYMQKKNQLYKLQKVLCNLTQSARPIWLQSVKLRNVIMSVETKIVTLEEIMKLITSVSCRTQSCITACNLSHNVHQRSHGFCYLH